jgi:SAM-dependent methyltransferase
VSGNSVGWDAYTRDRRGTGFPQDILLRYSGDRVLDVGCGMGRHLVTLGPKSVKVGIEISLGALKRAQDISHGVDFVQGSGYCLPFSSLSFDTVLSIDVIEHLERPADVLLEISRVLRFHGCLILQTPNYPIKRVYDFWHYMKGSRSQFQDDPTHVTKFNFSRLAAVVSQAGFEIDHATARNVFLDLYLPELRRLRNTQIGRTIGQKVIIVARKRADSHS